MIYPPQRDLGKALLTLFLCVPWHVCVLRARQDPIVCVCVVFSLLFSFSPSPFLCSQVINLI